ncbi:MAG: ABC transporter ATP-binding protein [Spirochaetes bacterium]|nr:MAG: ABC transporter ATP-binding protein [Spirochaetota bacterium]
MFKELKTLLPFARKYRSAYIIGFICLLATDAGEMYIPLLIKKAVDSLGTEGFSLHRIGTLMLLMLSIAVSVGAARFGWRFFIIGSSRRIERDLRKKIFDHLLTLSSTFFGSVKSGDIMARATNDMRSVRRASGMALVAFLDGTVLSVGIVSLLFITYGKLALVTILPLPFITLIILFAGKFIKKYFKSVQEGFSLLTERTRETFSGIRVIKSLTMETYFKKKFLQVNLQYKERNMRLVRLWGFFFPLISFISGLSLMLLLVFGGRAVINKQITPGDFTALISYLVMLIWPLMGMGFTVNILQRGAASMGRINNILKTEPDIVSPPRPVPFFKESDIKVKNLTFAYPGTDSPVIKEINAVFRRGATTGILGRTGSGKSTLLKLLPRLLDPPEGTLLIGDIDIRNYKLEVLRKNLGFVPQDTFLFSTTIRENISFGKPDAGDSEIMEICSIVSLVKDLENFPGGIGTEVGERGVTLSGGQKQRIAMGRALLPDPPVLIMDDPFSSVDTETESSILHRLFEKRQGKTNILVSHRVSTLSRCDYVYVLDGGRIVQRGTPGELLMEEGLYREIAVLQGEDV